MGTFLLAVALAAGAIKLMSTVYLVRLAAQAPQFLDRTRQRRIYYASKISPVVCVGALLLRAVFAGDSHAMIWSGSCLIVAAMLALVVVYLRRTGRWYGLAHSILRLRRNRHL
jgi:hypothetical protein